MTILVYVALKAPERQKTTQETKRATSVLKSSPLLEGSLHDMPHMFQVFDRNPPSKYEWNYFVN